MYKNANGGGQSALSTNSSVNDEGYVGQKTSNRTAEGGISMQPVASHRDELVSLRRDAETIEQSELTMLDLLGSGSFGTVHRARWRDKVVAVKTLKGDEVTRAQIRDLIAEAKLMARLPPHAHVLLLLGCVATPHVALVSELCEHGSLYDALQPVCCRRAHRRHTAAHRSRHARHSARHRGRRRASAPAQRDSPRLGGAQRAPHCAQRAQSRRFWPLADFERRQQHLRPHQVWKRSFEMDGIFFFIFLYSFFFFVMLLSVLTFFFSTKWTCCLILSLSLYVLLVFL